MQHLDYYGRKSLNIYILNNALENETVIPTDEEAEQALALLSTLVSDKNEQPVGEMDMEELAEEQCLLARFVHQLKSNVADDQYLILTAARKVIFLILYFLYFFLFWKFLNSTYSLFSASRHVCEHYWQCKMMMSSIVKHHSRE